MSDRGVRRRGRPRMFENTTERVQAFRKRHGLSKITIDVPARLAAEFKSYAKKISKSGRWKPAPANYLFDWTDNSGNEFHPAFCYASIYKLEVVRTIDSPARMQDYQYQWKIFLEDRGVLSVGLSINAENAKSVCETICSCLIDQ